MQAEQDAQDRLKSLREAAATWDQLTTLAERRHESDAERAKIGERQASLAEDMNRSAEAGEGPLADALTQASREHAERLARLEAERRRLRGERDRQEAQLSEARAKIAALQPRVEALQRRVIWSWRFWNARFNKSLPRQWAAAQEALASAEKAIVDLSRRHEELEQGGCRAAAEATAERACLIDAELSRLRRELDEAEDRLNSDDRTEDGRFGELSGALPDGIASPGERTIAAVRAAQAAWHDRLQRSEEQAVLFIRWRELVECDGDALIQQRRAAFNVVAGPLTAFACGASQVVGAFDLLVADEAHLLSEGELASVAQKARRWVLAGEPGLVAVNPAPGRAAGRTNQARRGRPAPDFFARLWKKLHGECWAREEGRLIFRPNPALTPDRAALEIEAVADRPEIELRILPNSGDPVLAEVAFPASTRLADARDYLFNELGEVPCQPRSRLAAWSASERGQTLHLNPTDVGSLPGRTVDLKNGISLQMHDTESDQGHEEFVLFFDAAAGWDRPKAETWAGERLLRRDVGRSVVLEKNYRQTPALAAWLNEAVVSGATYPIEQGAEGAVDFEPSPRRAPSTPRRGGAGLEIDLADPRQRELLPNDLAALLPPRGFVNLPEAQSVAELLLKLPSDHSVAITAPYAAQAMVLRHYLSNDRRVALPDELSRHEFDILIVSLTRSHAARAVTYGDDPAALIGLLTRPRCRLVFVGDPGTLSRRAQWEGAIDHLDEVAGERERRWVNALLRVLPARATPHSRASQRVKA